MYNSFISTIQPNQKSFKHFRLGLSLVIHVSAMRCPFNMDPAPFGSNPARASDFVHVYCCVQKAPVPPHDWSLPLFHNPPFTGRQPANELFTLPLTSSD